jgi:hypothetical protein
MAVTNQELFNIFLANPNMSDAQIVSLMEQRGISPEQVSSTFGIPVNQIVSRMAPVLTENVAQYGTQTQTLANSETGQTEISQRTLPGGFNAYQDESGQLSFSRVSPDRPGMIQLYGPNGEYRGEEKITTSTQDLIRNLGPIALAAGGTALLQGLPGFESLFSGAGSTAAATEGLTLSELGLGGSELATATNVADVVAGTESGLLSGGSLTSGITAADIAATEGGLLTGTKTAAELAQLDLATGGIGGSTGATNLANALATGADVSTVTSLTGGSGAFTGTAAGITAESVAQKLAADKVLTDAALAKKILDTGNTITSGLKTVGGLLQTEEDKAAAQLAAQNVTAATQAGVEGSQFRPIGMTTRFGTSEYKYDPVTGRMTSAGYQLSPEAKAAQDRLVKLAESGLVQAEGAQAQFAPLQTGAQSLFNLGNQYISRSPQDVAQNYLNQQMQLLQPGREMELANLQNRLQQQGRAGLSVAQGGTMGATTPELQALYNARARQEAELAANAQQLGQRDVLFGAGLLDRGATSMGNYYTGQTQAYSPFTTPLTQVQALETAAQQPLTMGSNLAQLESAAGYRAGDLSLRGAQAAGALSTGKAATTNPYAYLFSGVDPAFAQGIAKQIWGV